MRQTYRVLSLVLAHAVRAGRIPRNPAALASLPTARRAEKRFLTHAEVQRLAAAAGPYGLLVEVLAFTGLRWGELAALRVSRVDLLRRWLDMSSR